MSTPQRYAGGLPGHPSHGDTLADILERVLDKGIVIAGDITINVLDIELLTIKVRLLIASVDKAREMGINWWESDSALSNGGSKNGGLEQRLERLEVAAGIDTRLERERGGRVTDRAMYVYGVARSEEASRAAARRRRRSTRRSRSSSSSRTVWSRLQASSRSSRSRAASGRPSRATSLASSRWRARTKRFSRARSAPTRCCRFASGR